MEEMKLKKMAEEASPIPIKSKSKEVNKKAIKN